MKTKFLFKELSPKAQEKAILDYANGWLEEHPDDIDMDFREIVEEMDGDLYTVDGEYISEEY